MCRSVDIMVTINMNEVMPLALPGVSGAAIVGSDGSVTMAMMTEAQTIAL